MALKLIRTPFRSSPRPEQYVALATHDAMLAQLRQSLEGIVLLDGEPGCGKTMLALKLLAEHSSKRTPIYLPGCRFETPAALHQAILFDLGMDYVDRTENELRLAVREALLQFTADAKPPILAFDDAQDLSNAVMEELRALDNLPQASILLIASPSLRERLADPELASIVSRIAVRIRVELIDESTSSEFLRKQVDRCGGSEESFSEEAIALIAANGRGSPRLLNRLAHLALAIAQNAGEETVDVEPVLEAISRLAPSEESAHLSLTAESRGGASRSGATMHDSAAGRTPKTKARKRKAA